MVLSEPKTLDHSEQSETPVDSEQSEQSIDSEQSEKPVLSKQPDKSNDSEQSEKLVSSKQSEKSNDSGREGERPRSSRSNLALVYQADKPGLAEEDDNEKNSECPRLLVSIYSSSFFLHTFLISHFLGLLVADSPIRRIQQLCGQTTPVAQPSTCIHTHGGARRIYGNSTAGSSRIEEELVTTFERQLQDTFCKGEQAAPTLGLHARLWIWPERCGWMSVYHV